MPTSTQETRGWLFGKTPVDTDNASCFGARTHDGEGSSEKKLTLFTTATKYNPGPKCNHRLYINIEYK